MPVCQFFLQGRCRYGEKCWNEHTGGGGGGGRGGGGGGYNSNNRAPPPQQQPRGGGGGGDGFGHRVWVNPSQQRGGYVQPSSFGSRENDQWNRRGDGGGGSDWGRGGGGGGGFGRRENVKSSEYNFSQNRFSSLDTPSTFDKGAGAATTGDDDNDRKCETIQSDMEAWENSGQWGFSTYSHSKNPLSGFSDLSPEELRLEYYTSRASGNLQNYINGVNQLLSQWRSRVQELKVMNASTRAALIRELNSTAPQDSSKSFSSTDTGSAFGSKGFGAADQQSSFSFAAQATGFGSPSVSTSTEFGSAPTFGGAPSAPPPSSFGAPPAPSASAFSFAASDKTSAMTPTGFGSPSNFSFSASSGGGFGTGFGAQSPATPGVTSVFGQPSISVPVSAVPASGTSDSLFSSESNLTSEELDQFKAKRFMLGQIPLKTPPANLLSV
ncbi:nucleoporin NUP42 isoform X2 [Eucyclogobius newberryi]|uniref:nucleoporin NUP42 isoform X2 n=1 Tax=Eucyclogobius newberryi TaxID=166745 RepID=UPI003B5BE9C4